MVTAGYGDLNCLKDPRILEYRDFVSKAQVLEIIKKTSSYSSNYKYLGAFEKLALWKFSKDEYFIREFFSCYDNLHEDIKNKKIKLKTYRHVPS